MKNNRKKSYTPKELLLHKYYPNFESAKDLAKRFLEITLKPKDMALDLGCGRYSEDFREVKDRIRLIGVDYDTQAGSENRYLDEFKQVDLNKKLPFEDNTFNLVYSRFVLEHIENPTNVYNEVYRVLKPGGHFFMLTPNLYNPAIFLNFLLPESFHTFVKRILAVVKDPDIYPTYYRSNTVKKIQTQLTSSRFTKIKQIRKGGIFEYFMVSKPLFMLSIFLERITDIVGKCTKIHLVIICQK